MALRMSLQAGWEKHHRLLPTAQRPRRKNGGASKYPMESYFLTAVLASLARRLLFRAAALGWMSRLRPARSISRTASS